MKAWKKHYGKVCLQAISEFKNSLVQNEAKCKTFLVKKSFVSMRIKKNHFHVNGFTFRLVLKQRFRATRKSPPLSGHLRGAGKYKIISGFPIILSCNLCSVQRFRLKSTHAQFADVFYSWKSLTNHQTNTYFINCILIGLVFCSRWTCPKRQIADNNAANGYSACALHHLLNAGLLWYSSRDHFHGIQSLLPRLQVSFMHSLIKEKCRCFTRVGRYPHV